MPEIADKYQLPEYVTKRTRYFDGQFLRDDDFIAEQLYHIDRVQRHDRLLHVSGISDGLTVAIDSANTKRVKVSPGSALDAGGRQVLLEQDAFVQPDSGMTGTAYLELAFSEREADEADNEGVKGFTRFVQAPKLTFHSTKPSGVLLLAELTIAADGKIVQVSGGVRQYSGLKLPGPASALGGGALRSRDDSSPGWADLSCHLSVQGTLSVAESLNVSGNVTLGAGKSLKFADQGEISSLDNKHRILFRRSENILELREYGDIVLSSGATSGTATNKLVMLANGNVAIGTTDAAGYKLNVAGSLQTASAVVTGTAQVGTLTLTAPPGDPAPVLAARTVPADQGGSNERTELILFHGNDGTNGAGSDAITLRAPAIRLQTYNNAAVSGIDNAAGSNDRLTIDPDGNADLSGKMSIKGDTTLKANATVEGTLTVKGGQLSLGTAADKTGKLSLGRAKKWLLTFDSDTNFGSDKAFILFMENSGFFGTFSANPENVRLSIGVYNDFGQSTNFGDALDIQGGAQLTLNAGSWDSELNTEIGVPGTGEDIRGISFRINNVEKARINKTGQLQFPNEIGNKIIFWTGSATDTYGFGLNHSNLNAFIHPDAYFSLRTSGYNGADVFKVDGKGNMSLAGNFNPSYMSNWVENANSSSDRTITFDIGFFPLLVSVIAQMCGQDGNYIDLYSHIPPARHSWDDLDSRSETVYIITGTQVRVRIKGSSVGADIYNGWHKTRFRVYAWRAV